MDKKSKYHLFEVSGIELEYMIVDRGTLKVKPVADELFFNKTENYLSDYVNGKIDWSNELVNHVIELKTHKPVSNLKGVDADFINSITEINSILGNFNAMLLPTSSHPFMDPVHETVLWQHEYNGIYALYNSIFDCRGHGWSNLQCVHLNLPFAGDEEFSRLHAAIRILLPLIPALAASSPLRDGKLTGWTDSRMESYLKHQEKMPSLMGKLIPETVFSEEEYYEKIFIPIKRDIAPYDKTGIMDHHFLNSRGAIARFDRGAIEIRVTDIQECPAADIAISSVIIEVLKQLVDEKWSKFSEQCRLDEEHLLLVFNSTIRKGEDAIVEDSYYLNLFGIYANKKSAGEIWYDLLNRIRSSLEKKNIEIIDFILKNGTLSNRIIRNLNNELTLDNIIMEYRKLASCLVYNEMYK